MPDNVTALLAMSGGGSVDPEKIAEVASEWLEENLATPSTPPIDSSLTVANAAADAKATGGEITEINQTLDEMFGELYDIERFDWSALGIKDYPYGWHSGYYDTATGAAKNSGAFMRSYNGKYVDISNASFVRLVPPTGYAVALGLYMADNTFTCIGQANTQTYPENINKEIFLSVKDYVKCVVTVGRFANVSGDNGGSHSQDETFVNSILLDIYTPKNLQPKDYYKSETERVISDVRSAIDEPALVFPLVTDIHYLSVNESFLDCITNVKEVCKAVSCDFVMNLGDNTDGNATAETTLQRNFFMLSQFAEIGIPYYQAIGNHDTNLYLSGAGLSSDQIWSSYLSNTHGVHFDMTAGEKNFYKDFDELGIRLIVLDANHNERYGYSTNTANWLTSKALDTNYIVVLAEHLSSIPSQNWNNGAPTNNTYVTNALQAFVTGGGTLIQICGHSHADYYFNSPWLTVFSTCQKMEQADTTTEGFQIITGYAGTIDAPERTVGTASEDSWSVVVVKPISRTIDFIRFGAGNNRSFGF